ncbi:MAG: hypothetical protein LBT66_08615 [Methanobrevibacter sp.]|nr:hypothetical protein [Candidatus Methanovirga meridionalis]
MKLSYKIIKYAKPLINFYNHPITKKSFKIIFTVLKYSVYLFLILLWFLVTILDAFFGSNDSTNKSKEYKKSNGANPWMAYYFYKKYF